MLCPEPVLPQATPLPPLVRWHGVERHYVLCEDDRTIPPEYQETMAAAFPPDRVARLPSGHSPFFSMPARLAALLDAIEAPAGPGAGQRPLPFTGTPR